MFDHETSRRTALKIVGGTSLAALSSRFGHAQAAPLRDEEHLDQKRIAIGDEVAERHRPFLAHDSLCRSNPGAVHQHSSRTMLFVRRGNRGFGTGSIGDVASDGDTSDLACYGLRFFRR